MSNERKVMSELDESQAKINKAKDRIKYECDHQSRPGEPALEIVRKDNDPSQSCYRCRKCKKLISMQVPTNADVDSALGVFETMSDYTRLLTDASTEKGHDTCEELAKFMMQANKIAKSFKQLREAKEKKARSKNDRSGSHASAHYEG